MGLFDFFKKKETKKISKAEQIEAAPVFYPSKISSAIADAKYLRTDLIEVTTSSPYCGECAKYVNRIFSISGKDRRFPALPPAFASCGSGHNFSCLSFYPYVDGVNEPNFKCRNVIKYSNRPFADERTPAEIKRYDDWQRMIAEDAAKKAKTEQCRKEFSWLQTHLPTLCPKSLSGYVRMKNSNSKSYQKLVSEAAKLGKNLS